MIVPSMTEEEIKRAIEVDLPELTALSAAQNPSYRRAVIKAKSFPLYFQPIVKKTKAQNTWYLFMEARSKKEKDGCHVTFACIMNGEGGLHCFISSFSSGNMIQFSTYTPHFFRRFRERKLQELTGILLMLRFVQLNHSCIFKINKVPQGSDGNYMIEVFGCGNDGVSLGYYTVAGNVLFKTFINVDMLRNDQIGKYQHIKSVYESTKNAPRLKVR